MGVRSQCKQCVAGPARERTRKWLEKHGEEANAKRRRERRDDPEKFQQRDRERYAQKKRTDTDRERERRYRQRNREQLREYQRKWREAHPGKWAEYRKNESSVSRERRLAYHRKRKAEQHSVLDNFKREAGCVDCGAVSGRLEFDHRVKADKRFSIPHGLGCAWETIWEEVAKCDVRCATCHRKRHAGSRKGTAALI